MKRVPNYRRKGVKVNNKAPLEHRKVRPRLLVTSLGNTFRWRIMVEETQVDTGTALTRKAANDAGRIALGVWIARYTVK